MLPDDRFEEGEAAIARDANFAFLYALNVLRGKFEAGEKVLRKDKKIWAKYQAEVLQEGI